MTFTTRLLSSSYFESDPEAASTDIWTSSSSRSLSPHDDHEILVVNGRSIVNRRRKTFGYREWFAAPRACGESARVIASRKQMTVVMTNVSMG